ncbi:energy transducer TonB [Lysobacter pythonis]|uniref:Protein TonB n=1 Tax=Solilutibacter pythonis TaxID=2483112 RepID=A0A3M2HSC9_9GAMM|nr:energy transducer TonB [Lysobacter pythonis]RMH90733.1 energy transducer TonB [Lysobacter pythonis]
MNGCHRGWVRWAGGFAAALALHTAAIGASLYWARLPDTPTTPMPALLVDMTPEPKTAAPPTDLPPGPPQPAQDAARPKPRPKPKPEQPKPPHPDVEPLPAPVPDPAPAETPEADNAHESEASLASAPPSAALPSAEQAAGRQALSGIGKTRVSNWQGALLAHLERHRRYPREAERAGLQGTVYVRISVDRQGNLLGWRITRGSGHDLLDEAALATVQRANPVPPPPPDITPMPVEVMIPVDFSIRRKW